MKTCLHFGIVGTGSIIDLMISNMQKVEGIKISAIYGRTKEKTEQFAIKYKIPFIYTNFQEMLENKTIDCVYIGSLNAFHYEHAKSALEHHKHVLCEKPFTSTLQQLLHLKKIAQQYNLILMEAIPSIHMPILKIIQKNLNKLENIHIVLCNFTQYSRRYDAYKKKSVLPVFDPMLCGGSLSDINIYNLHFCIQLFGKPLSYMYYPNKGYNGIDTSGCIILNYLNFQAICIASKDSKGISFIQIQSENGYLYIEGTSSSLNHQIRLSIDGEQHMLNTESSDPQWNFIYEVKSFYNIVQQHDLKTCALLLEQSQAVIEVYEGLRKQAHICFPCDHT